MLKIKLQVRGKKHQRTYRVVLAECRSKSNGKFIADLGFCNPFTKETKINQELLKEWTAKGAKVTEGVDKLLNPDKYPRKKKVKKEKKTE